jgi:hypothetical protein
MTDTATVVTFVNVTTTTPRTMVVQGGAYAEHLIESDDWNGKTVPVGKSNFTVTLNQGGWRKTHVENETLLDRPNSEFPV